MVRKYCNGNILYSERKPNLINSIAEMFLNKTLGTGTPFSLQELASIGREKI